MRASERYHHYQDYLCLYVTNDLDILITGGNSHVIQICRPLSILRHLVRVGISTELQMQKLNLDCPREF